jgi:hypothetical protein
VGCWTRTREDNISASTGWLDILNALGAIVVNFIEFLQATVLAVTIESANTLGLAVAEFLAAFESKGDRSTVRGRECCRLQALYIGGGVGRWRVWLALAWW